MAFESEGDRRQNHSLMEVLLGLYSANWLMTDEWEVAQLVAIFYLCGQGCQSH